MPSAAESRWTQIMRHWALVEADLQDRGVDLEEPGLLESRSWRWLRIRVEQLFSVPPAAFGSEAIPQTRIGLRLTPPTAD